MRSVLSCPCSSCSCTRAMALAAVEDGSFRAGVTLIYADRYEVLSCGEDATLIHELAHAWEHHCNG